MYKFIISGIFTIFIQLVLMNEASANSNNLAIKKGRVADFLFVTDRKDVEHLKPDYFKDIYPPAQKIGFQRSTFFFIERKPISGEYFPYVVAIGSWPGTWTERQSLFDELVSARPDIRDRRLAIWSSFNMLNAQIEEDVDITLDPSKIYVLGAYWQKNEESFSAFEQLMATNTKQHGGKIRLAFDEVNSMFGYTEPANLLTLTEWNSQADFDTFYKETTNIREQATKATSEFYLSVHAEK